MVLDSEPLSKIFTVGLSYWRISKETYYGLPTRRVLFSASSRSVTRGEDIQVRVTDSAV